MNRIYQQDQAASPTLPTVPSDSAGAPIGLVLADQRGFRLSIAAPPGQTLDGTGSMRCLMWHPALSLWLRNPDLDMEVGAASAGQRGRVFPDLERFVTDNVQIYYYRDAVGVSGGGNLTVRLDGQDVTR